MGSVLTFGETMGLVRATDIGGWETVSAAQVGIGGADSNVAIGLSRLGIPVSWIGRVGDDALGRRITREIRGEGVRIRAIIDPSHPSGLMLKERPTPTRTRVTFYRSHSAGSQLSPEDIRDRDIEESEIVIINGVTASLSDSARQAALSVARRARTAGVTIAFDVNHRASLWHGRQPGPLYAEIARASDIVFAGDDEARLLLGISDASPELLAERLSGLGPGEVVIKSGANGALSRVNGTTVQAAAIPIDPVDTVGAGDAFVAGYLAALLHGHSPFDRLSLGVRCGAFACLGPGDWESLPRLADLEILNPADPVSR